MNAKPNTLRPKRPTQRHLPLQGDREPVDDAERQKLAKQLAEDAIANYLHGGASPTRCWCCCDHPHRPRRVGEHCPSCMGHLDGDRVQSDGSLVREEKPLNNPRRIICSCGYANAGDQMPGVDHGCTICLYGYGVGDSGGAL